MELGGAKYGPGEHAEAGLYTVPMVARILTAKPKKVRSWVEGFGNSDAAPILLRQLPRVDGKTVLGFLDLIESAFIQHFREAGFSAQTIRKVALKLGDRHGVDHPFATDKRFRANVKHIFEEVVSDEGEKWLVNLMNDNFEIVPAVELSLFDQVFYVEDIARAWQPLREHPNIVMDPKISFGRPVARGIWISTETLFAAFKAEGDLSTTAEEHGVPSEQVFDAVNFERDIRTRALH